jgi:hypothetical protein
MLAWRLRMETRRPGKVSLPKTGWADFYRIAFTFLGYISPHMATLISLKGEVSSLKYLKKFWVAPYIYWTKKSGPILCWDMGA